MNTYKYNFAVFAYGIDMEILNGKINTKYLSLINEAALLPIADLVNHKQPFNQNKSDMIAYKTIFTANSFQNTTANI